LITLTTLVSAPANAQQRVETVFRDARAYTVRIRTQIETSFLEDERGSFSGAGFLVDAGRRWVVTNAHVVGQSPSEVQVAFVDGTYRPARKIYVDSFIDMAVLEVADDGQRHPVAPINCEGITEVGEGVGAFGHPLGMPFTGTRGIVSGKTDQYLADLLQIDATIDHGNSGGPVISLRDGRIVGIATAGAGGDKTNRLNLATPMKDVCRILDLLRQGIAPDPQKMEFSLLVDQDNRHTLEVGCTYEATRWPFEPGDRIVTVGVERRPVTTIGSLVSALRGRVGAVPIRVVRAGHEIEIQARPGSRVSVVARRGVLIDGALIAPSAFEDLMAIAEPTRLTVQDVESGSVAEALGLAPLDVIHSVDGRVFDDLDSLVSYLDRRSSEHRLRIVVRRVSSGNRWFDFHVRELPGEDITPIGPENELLTTAP
jgi:S1-C subfamily serine protease